MQLRALHGHGISPILEVELLESAMALQVSKKERTAIAFVA